MGYPWRLYPKLEDRHVQNAKLFADRASMIRAIGKDFPAKRVAEVGVGFGGFSEVLLETFQPEEFVAFDLFDAEKKDVVWGKPIGELLGEHPTHLDFYRDKFKAYPVTLVQGPSQDTLKSQPDGHFDLVYLDGDHAFEGIRRDAEEAVRICAPGGIIVFNDYIMSDFCTGEPYGVVQVANEVIVNGGWEVIGFALDQSMFCDVAVRRVG